MSSENSNIVAFPGRHIRRPPIIIAACRPDGTPLRKGDAVRLTGSGQPIGGTIVELGPHRGSDLQTYFVMCHDGIARPARPPWIEYAGPDMARTHSGRHGDGRCQPERRTPMFDTEKDETQTGDTAGDKPEKGEGSEE